MWPFRKNTLPTLDVEKSIAIIRDYLNLLPVSGSWKDADLLNSLVEKGHDKALSWYAIGMVPIFAGRELMDGMGISFSSFLVLYDDKKKTIQSHMFLRLPRLCRHLKIMATNNCTPQLQILAAVGAGIELRKYYVEQWVTTERSGIGGTRTDSPRLTVKRSLRQERCL